MTTTTPSATAPGSGGALAPAPATPGAAQRILVVSPYPPVRDGIGAYAVQQVRALRRAGHHVEVLSPQPSAAHHHLDLRGPRGALGLRRAMAGFDRVVVHFHPDFFYDHPATPSSRTTTGLALAAAFRSGPEVVIRLHEVDHRWVAPSDPSAFATRAVFRSAAKVEVHVPEHEREMVEEFRVPAARVELVDHGADFVARTAVDRAGARASLGLPEDEHVFLCIGFVQPHKGFDRAITAFRGLAGKGASLHVVGSVRVDDPHALDHQRELEALTAQVPGTHLHLGFVSDEAFDRWIVAADTVVLPYRHIWSSSVVERARLLGRRIIATRVGGLGDQLAGAPDAVVVEDNRELAAAMRAELGGDAAPGTAPADGGPTAPATTWDFGGPVDRDAVMAEVHRRAAAARGVRVAPGADAPTRRRPTGAATTPLRRLRPLPPPPATSARPGVSTVKRLIRRLVAWEIDPLREQLVRLQQSTLETAENLDAELDDVRAGRPDDGTPHEG